MTYCSTVVDTSGSNCFAPTSGQCAAAAEGNCVFSTSASAPGTTKPSEALVGTGTVNSNLKVATGSDFKAASVSDTVKDNAGPSKVHGNPFPLVLPT
jgi:hypothetical protein